MREHASEADGLIATSRVVARKQAPQAAGGHRYDLATPFGHPADDLDQPAKAFALTIETLRTAHTAEPHIAGDIAQWLTPCAVKMLYVHNLTTLADLTMRSPRRRQWWKAMPGLGAAGARAIKAFVVAWRALRSQKKARALAVAS
ncbi:phage integrase family protein [Paraburkholderia guartelaensis]|uniref:phage integrase family protein n=1 Tax=Paraburkholderia guartelaensis TaxID=2546446 RepID=UPI00319DED69